MEALYEVTKTVQNGKLLSASGSTPYTGKIVHVGYSFGSESIYTLAYIILKSVTASFLQDLGMRFPFPS